jgi:Mg2+/Co2+ transporter CorB
MWSRLVDDKSHVLTSILIGNTVALLAADSLATTIAIRNGVGAAGAVVDGRDGGDPFAFR